MEQVEFARLEHDATDVRVSPLARFAGRVTRGRLPTADCRLHTRSTPQTIDAADVNPPRPSTACVYSQST